MIKDDLYYMSLALEQAKKAAQEWEIPVGAVIVRDGEIIASAHNNRERTGDATGHAELLAIREACRVLGGWHLEKCELYVTLEPCAMCAGAAINARVSEIIFGAADPVKGALGSVTNLYSFNFPNKPTVYGGIKEKQAVQILQDFFKAKREKTSTL